MPHSPQQAVLTGRAMILRAAVMEPRWGNACVGRLPRVRCATLGFEMQPLWGPLVAVTLSRSIRR
jgi:hypothetical protein